MVVGIVTGAFFPKDAELCGSDCLLARTYIALHHTLAVVAQLSCDADRI